MTLHVPVVPDERLRPLIVAAFCEFAGGDWHASVGEQEPGSILLGASESRVGNAGALADALRAIPTADDAFLTRLADSQLIPGTLPNFAFQVHEDPAYQWLGDLIIHVPGLAPDFESACDAEGEAVLTAGQLDEVVALARDVAPRLPDGRRLRLADRLARLTGAAHREAFRALQ